MGFEVTLTLFGPDYGKIMERLWKGMVERVALELRVVFEVTLQRDFIFARPNTCGFNVSVSDRASSLHPFIPLCLYSLFPFVVSTTFLPLFTPFYPVSPHTRFITSRTLPCDLEGYQDI